MYTKTHKRTRDFDEVFQALHVCETVLAKEKQYEEMLRLRKSWLENKIEKKMRNRRRASEQEMR